MTKKYILHIAISNQACQEGIDAFEAWQNDYQSFCFAFPEYGFWMEQFGSFMSPDTLRACALAFPLTTLKYASHKMDSKMLRECALEWPAEAIFYASKKLDPATLRECQRRAG